MSEEIKVTLPKLGESIVGATIVQWFKKVGQRVELDEPLLEVSTDKVNSEIPSPVSGVLQEIHAPVDAELKVGDLLACITVTSHQGTQVAPPKKECPLANDSAAKDFFSPALLRLAREKKISLEEVEALAGTGAGGRVTRQDLEDYLEKKGSGQPASIPPCTSGIEVERIQMSGMRKAIAENMVRSFYEAPHATLIAEIDVTGILKIIQREKETFQTVHGAKLTITSFVAQAITRALQEFPFLNSSLEKDTIVLKRFIHLGIAVSVDQGLIVPVMKHCQRMQLPQFAKTIGDLSKRARENKLRPEEITEGTLTITNFGMSGALIGIPIIRYPEVAIVGVGAIQKKVVVLEEETFAVRSLMHVSLTFDHRVLDGMYGCGFLASLKKHLEENVSI